MFALEGLQIADITFTSNTDERKTYLIELQEGGIELQAEGFIQIVRQQPVYGHQSIEMNKRGGISFNRTPLIIL